MYKVEMVLLVNFGGPRNLEEIPEFLTALLQDKDVVSTKLPSWLHNFLFARIARKRSKTIAHDYLSIGGRSPIYFDTEALAEQLRMQLQCPVATFHRYLPATHKESLQAIENSSASSITVLPLFPQFSYATTGSIARFFTRRLSPKTLQKLQWIKSYPVHPAFIEAHKTHLSSFLQTRKLTPENTFLLFSAHGLPCSFVAAGDPYQIECEQSYRTILECFPNFPSLLAYQSQFGKGIWLSPSTANTCQTLPFDRPNVVLIPLSFTSDHIETLFEIEQLYLPMLQKRGFTPQRCPALNLESHWIQALSTLAQDPQRTTTLMLVRR